jgi:cytochrome P450
MEIRVLRKSGGRLTVCRALQRQKGKGLVFVDTKTHRSRRYVSLPAITTAALRAHRIRQATERLVAGWSSISVCSRVVPAPFSFFETRLPRPSRTVCLEGQDYYSPSCLLFPISRWNHDAS